MSVLLLTNPFATQQPPSGTSVETAATGPLAVTPSRPGASGSQSGNSTSYSGFGSGAGGNGAQQPAVKSRTAARAPDATSGSVVTAQVAGNAGKTLTPAITDATEIPDFAQRIEDAANEMPDPLPTSPFLKGAKSAQSVMRKT